MTTSAAALASPRTDAAKDFTSFIEVQLPVSKLSKECYKERKANAGQTLTALGSYWKGRKPLILVRAVVLGLLLPATDDSDRDREIFLKLMLMDEEGRLKRRKRFDRKMASRVVELLPEVSWSRAIEPTGGGRAWRRGVEPDVREAVEIETFLKMGLDEQLRHCLRPEELPDSALDDVWDEVNAHLGTNAHSLPELVEELGARRFGKRPRVGDPFCGGGSIPFEAARLGCDVYASDLNPIACLLTWGALNIVGGSDETRARIAAAQKAIVRAVDEEIIRLGIEHDGDQQDLRLLAGAPTRWFHGYRIGRSGEIIEADAPPHAVTCPRTGWRVPMIETRQVSERHKAILELVPSPATRAYRIEVRANVDDDDWSAADHGTVIRSAAELFLVHDPGDGEVRVRIANRAKAYLYCVEVEDPNTGWRVPLAPSWVISKNYRTIGRLVPDHASRRFEIEIVEGVDDAALEAAGRGTVAGGDLDFEIDGRSHQTSMERLRGEVRLRSRYSDPEEEARDRQRFAACRNHYSDTAANDLRPWELTDIVPRPGDVFQERLYAVQWLTPDGELFFTKAREEDLARERQVEEMVRANLADWQARGLVPDSRIEPGYNTTQPIRERGWTHWHHLFTPRHLLAGALIQERLKQLHEPEAHSATAIFWCRTLNYLSRLTQWRVGHTGERGTAPAADAVNHVFYNQALNTFVNFGARSFPTFLDALWPEIEAIPLRATSTVRVLPASQLDELSELWVTDPPYADAIHYHEITEYFIAWLSKSPPRRDWIWDTRRELAIRGESTSFRRSMVEAYSAMTRHMPDNGFQVVMFTHQDVGVWADLAEILWAAGLQVTAGWCVATETESATRVGNYVQGTVLLVLRKRLGNEAGFIARLQRPVENAVHAKLQTMRALDHGEEPNFGDADYQLAAYSAALEVLTRYATIDGRPVAAEVLRERRKGEESEVERLLRRAVRIASDFLVPEGLAREIWDDLGPEERFYVKGLDLERAGEGRSASYQEMARGFGVETYRPMLGSTDANKVRLKTAKEFGRRDLRRSGSEDRAEDRELEGFAGGLVRHVLYGVHEARETGQLKGALDWFAASLPDYWPRQRRVIGLLDFLGTIRTPARVAEAETARALTRGGRQPPALMTLRRFSSRLERLSQSFLERLLEGAVAYNRIAGYFRSSVFEIAGEPFERIEGPIRIVCNSGLDVRDVDVARAIFNEWCEGQPEAMTARQRPRYDRLAKLLRARRVEIRVLPDASFGLIHGKAGVIRYADGRSTCFLGSINETGEAWSHHYELLWEDEDPASVAWVQAEFDALWAHRDSRQLADVVVEDVERILNRRVVQVAEWHSATEEQAPFIEAPASRQGVGLAPHQRAFVARVVRELDVFGQARFVLADDVGLGKTVQLGMAAEIIALTRDDPVLVLAPKNLLLQWQEELQRMLALPSARWVDNRWVTEDEVVWPLPATACPRRIGLFPTSLVTAESETAQALLSRRYACVILDEAHRARRSRPRGQEGGPNNLLRFMLEIASRAETVLLGTATPIQIDQMELYELLRILHRGCERVLGAIGSPWRHDPRQAMDLVAGRIEPPSSIAQLWAWLRDPLIPKGEDSLATQVRAALDLPDNQTAASVDALDRLGAPLQRLLEALGGDLVRYHNPFVRHVIKRRRHDLKNPDGTPVFREVPLNLHGEGDDESLLMSDNMAAAYDDARAYCQLIAKIRPGAGILRTLLLRRIGSSLRAGLLTARKLRAGEQETLVGEEDEGLAREGVADVEGEALVRLESAIARIEAAGDDDPKLRVVLAYLRREGWADRGCILFSQYLDTALWLAQHLAHAFPEALVGLYGGQGNSFLLQGDHRHGAAREDIQARVRDRSLRLLVATDAASEGLNLQRLETLINVDLPWNPARLEQRKGRIDRIGQLAIAIDILNLRYRHSVEDEVHQALSSRLEQIRDIFGTIPDTLEDVWVATALGKVEEARRRINEVPSRHPFELRYAQDLPDTAWERCVEVLDRHDVLRVMKQPW